MRKYIIIISLIALLFALGACGKSKEQSKTMQQIQETEGVPVRIQTVDTETFVQQLRYNASLSGKQESTAQSDLSEVVSQIHAKVGDRVSKGQLILSFPTTAPAAQYEQAATAFAAQQTAYQRMQRLYESGAISKQELDNVETMYKVSKANLESSESMIKVRAPISGILSALHVSQSDKVYPGKDLFTVSATDGYKAVMMVPTQDAPQIKKGSLATAEVNGEILKGRITEVGMAPDPMLRAVRVVATFNGMNRKISFGSTATVNIDVFSKPNCIVVNREHLSFENGNAYVWVAENNRSVRKEVTLGLNDQLHYEVLTGLNEGDQLIIAGMNLVSEDGLIRIMAEEE